MDARENTLTFYTCQCCKESYISKKDADRCCSGIHMDEQDNIWERRLDLSKSSIPVCPHH